MGATIDLEKLIHRATHGDAAALEALLHAHYTRIEQYVRKHLPVEIQGSIEPGDVVQETVYEACRLITGFQPVGEDSFFRWLATIARHHIIDIVRMHKVRHGASEAEGDDDVSALLGQLAAHRRSPSRSAAAHEFMAAAEAAIERLPEEYRQAVRLRHLEGLSVEQVAERIGRTPEAVSWLCFRGLRTIRADLQSASLFR